MSAVQTDPGPSRLRLFLRVAIYALLCGIWLATISPLAQPESDTWLTFAIYRLGMAAWSAQVLILAAVLTLSVPSQLLAFHLVLLTAFVQGYAYVGLRALWSGAFNSDLSDNQIRFAVLLGLSAALSAVVWLLYRIVLRVGLSDEAARSTVGSRQFGLRELMYVTGFLSVVFGCASLFSSRGVIPTEQMLFLTIAYAAEIGPSACLPFWLAAYPRIVNWHWLWVVPLSLANVAVSVWSAYPDAWFYGTAAFVGIVLGNALTVAINGAALHALGLTWRQWMPDVIAE